ncbi:MAG TPA: hypothetical protein VFX76_14445 [Roseiflexaceae bacterium]|nr:hypothetical protein [Roseiflexaceae bacterium]
MRRYWFSIVILATLMFASAPQAQAQARKLCFKEVPNCVEGRFAEYWQENGGLAVFGFPLNTARTERVGGGTFLAQRFERNRFELHPENDRPYDVLLGRRGDEALRRQGRDWQSFPKVSRAPSNSCFFSDATGHAVCGEFYDYFRTHGLSFDGKAGFSESESIALFGLPLGEPATETNSSGDRVRTQWFERARFEFHPNNPDLYKVLLGRLGAEAGSASAADPCAGIPASVNATVVPVCFKAETQVTARATGFNANERVSYTVTPPAGIQLPAFLLTGTRQADANGVVELRNSFPAGTPPGLYSIAFNGADSRRSGVIYFKIIE